MAGRPRYVICTGGHNSQSIQDPIQIDACPGWRTPIGGEGGAYFVAFTTETTIMMMMTAMATPIMMRIYEAR